MEHSVRIEVGSERLDRALQPHLPHLSRTQLQRLISAGDVLVNRRPARSGQKVEPGDEIAWREPVPVVESNDRPESIPLDIVYRDDGLLVVNKPRGLVVHPGPGHPSRTLVNAVLALAPDLPGPPDRPGIVHRLDAGTTGLMVVALCPQVLRALQRLIAAREMERHYRVIVLGTPRFEEAVVDAPLGRNPYRRKQMTVLPEGQGRTARTDLAVLERFPGAALLEATLHTGRTHQIRAHCSYIGLPVLGDPTYGPRGLTAESSLRGDVRQALHAMGGQALHAGRLAFRHPTTGELMNFQAEPPADFQALLHALRG